MITSCAKRILRTGLLLVCLAHFASATAIAAPEDPLPKDWKVDLEPAYKLLGEQLPSAPQQGMNRISGAQFHIRDVELCIAYLQLYVRLPAAEREKLKDEQAKWIPARAKAAKTSAEGDAGGSLAPTEYNLTAAAWTEKRRDVLKKRLANTAGEPAAGVSVPALPKGWQPDIQSAIDWLDGDSEDGPVTAISRNRHFQSDLRDAELALAYLDLWARTDADDRKRLKAEQIDWLATRSKQSVEAAKGQDDETLAALKSSHKSTEMTVKRTVELRRRLTATARKPKR